MTKAVPTRHAFRIVGAALGIACLAGLSAAGAQEQRERSAAELMDVLMWNREPVGGPFALTDHTGRARTDADFRGKLMLVYFGFTFCPDICPADLQEMSRAVDLLGPGGDQVQPIFITVDPERDTAEHLATYVSLFHPRLIGLTGSEAAIRAAARNYKVYHAKAPIQGGYTVDHSAYVYLMDRDGSYLGFFPPNTPGDRMVAIIRPHLAKAP